MSEETSTRRTGYVHPLLHVNYVEPRPGIEPCFDCGREMDDNYTEPNRCATCNAAHRAKGGSTPVSEEPARSTRMHWHPCNSSRGCASIERVPTSLLQVVGG